MALRLTRLALFLAAPLALALGGCEPKTTAPAPSASSAPASSAPASEAPPPSDLPSSETPPPSDLPPSSSPISGFTFDPPGQLVPTSGSGVTDSYIYVPGMRFPLQTSAAYANSQVYGHGGGMGPGGSECDAANHVYPWHDNFCEKRGYTTILCPSGTGHQGQDIRAATCTGSKYVVVAAESGVISQIGSYTVYLDGDSGRKYLYLHMNMKKLKVHLGDRVARAAPLGLLNNDFGGTPTTHHLHFEVKMPVHQGTTTVITRVPPYTSLVDAYQRLLISEAGAP